MSCSCADWLISAPFCFLLLTQNRAHFARKPSSDIPPPARILNPSDTKVNFGLKICAHLAESDSIFSRNTEMRTIMGTSRATSAMPISTGIAAPRIRKSGDAKGIGISPYLPVSREGLARLRRVYREIRVGGPLPRAQPRKRRQAAALQKRVPAVCRKFFQPSSLPPACPS